MRDALRTHQPVSLPIGAYLLICILAIVGLPPVIHAVRHIAMFACIGVPVLAVAYLLFLTPSFDGLKSHIATFFHRSSVHRPFTVPVTIQSMQFNALLDTGSAVTLVSNKVWSSLPGRTPLVKQSLPDLATIDGSSIPLHGSACLTFSIDDRQVSHNVLVGDVQPDVLLGVDFFRTHGCVLNPADNSLKFPTNSPPRADACNNDTKSVHHQVCHVQLTTPVAIPPFSQVLLPGKLQFSPAPGDYLLEASGKLPERYDLLCQDAAIHVQADNDDAPSATVGYPVFNFSDQPITLPQGVRIGSIMPCIPVDDDDTSAICAATTLADDGSREPQFDLSHLDSADRRSVQDLMSEYADCVSTGPFDTGHTEFVTHTIDTSGAPPVRIAPRRLPIHQQQEVREHIDKLRDHHIIRPSNSPWSAPIVVVRKPDNSIRLCVDYRQLNNITVKDAFPMPRIDDAIDAMSGARYFTTIDLASGYWQVGMDKDARRKSAFVTPFGFYEWTCIPFGLCNAPATFQRLMNAVLGDLIPSTCLVYLDDIIVFSRTFKEHLQRLRSVLDRLREARLKVKPSKCSLVNSSVGYLGHVFSADGVRPDLAKIKAVSTWKQPTSITGVRQFLGFASYYRRFIHDFAKIATPLHALTRKHSTFAWPPEAQNAFDQLRQHLSSAPVLAYPDADKSFILDTDASDHAIGAVLSQIGSDGAEHPIAYASKTLSSGQRNYTTTKRELLAVIEFTHYFRHYLLGATFLLRTDHKALLWLSSFKNPDGIVARWIERLSAFDYETRHRPGSQHVNADSLSRLCGHVCSSPAAKSMCLPPAASAAVSSCGVSLSTGELDQCTREPAPSASWLPSTSLRTSQAVDPSISLVMKWVRSQQRPPKGSDELAAVHPDVHRLWTQFNRLIVQDGVLYRRYESTDELSSYLQLVLPASQRPTVVRSLHAGIGSGHLGVNRTIDKARTRFYWPHMADDIEQCVRTCPECQKRKAPQPKTESTSAIANIILSKPACRHGHHGSPSYH